MKKYLRLSTISLLASSFLLGSMPSFAGTCDVPDGNYSGTSRSSITKSYYKGSVPVRHYKKARYIQPCPNILLGGLYIGAAGGYDSYKVRNYAGINDGTGDSIGSSSFFNATGFLGSLFVGYGYYFNIAYLGAEIFGNTSNAITSYSSNFTSADGTALNYYNKFTVRGSYGISLLPGVKIADSTLIYARVGYSRASIRTNESLSATSPIESANFIARTGSYKNGFSYGLGLESLIYENFSVRSEYTHTQYSSTVSPFGTVFRPSDNQFMLGVIYHFVFC